MSKWDKYLSETDELYAAFVKSIERPSERLCMVKDCPNRTTEPAEAEAWHNPIEPIYDRLRPLVPDSYEDIPLPEDVQAEIIEYVIERVASNLHTTGVIGDVPDPATPEPAELRRMIREHRPFDNLARSEALNTVASFIDMMMDGTTAVSYIINKRFLMDTCGNAWLYAARILTDRVVLEAIEPEATRIAAERMAAR